MVTQEDIDAFSQFNEPLNEKESEEKEKKLKTMEEKREFLSENDNTFSVKAEFRLSVI